MFYDIKNNTFKYDDIFYQDSTIKTENGDIQAQNTYFLNACDDEILKELGFARVVEQERIENSDETKREVQKSFYDSEKNLYIISYELEDIKLDELKRLKLEDLAILKAEKLLYMPYKDTSFQIDTEAKINISGKASEIMLSQMSQTDLGTIYWIDKDNKMQSFSVDEFLKFAVSVANYTQSIIFKNDELRTKINNATSKDELLSINWE